MKKLIAALLFALCAASALFAWDVEHDEVAQLTGEFLPKEVKATFDFDDFAILMANCHFPDMTEWPCENGRRRFHTLEELAKGVGEENARVFAALGFTSSNWFHTPKGRAALMGMLARTFAKGEHAAAAFIISVLTHAVSDEGALNHPPLLGFFRYSKLPGIDFTMRKVEDGAKNVFGFRSDGHVVHLVRERMKGYRPRVPAGSFEEAALSLGVEVAVNHCALTGEIEGAIAFAPQPEAERALVDLVHRQVSALEDIVWTCWTHRSRDAALPGEDFDRAFRARATEVMRTVDPRRQSVFAGIFDASLNPAGAKATIGIVCDAYAREFVTISFPGRILSAAAGRTLRANGYAVKGLAYWEAAKGLPDPSEVQIVLVCIGGAGYMCPGADPTFAAAAREYRRKGGRGGHAGHHGVRRHDEAPRERRRAGLVEVASRRGGRRPLDGACRDEAHAASRGGPLSVLPRSELRRILQARLPHGDAGRGEASRTRQRTRALPGGSAEGRRRVAAGIRAHAVSLREGRPQAAAQRPRPRRLRFESHP